jgi:hypothetical protein
MKKFLVTAILTIDETNPNAPSLEDFKLGVENAILTPDNESFGIKDVEIVGHEVDDKGNFVDP